MADPIMAAVATALAARSAETVGSAETAGAAGPVAWAALVRLVRDRFAADRTAPVMLAEAQSRPGDPQRVHALAGTLDRIASQDRAFDTELRALWATLTYRPATTSRT